MTKTIALLNMKGGVGKTILAANLAWHFHLNENANVLLVDLDPQFNATQYVMDFTVFNEHLKKSGTIVDLLMNPPTLTPKQKKLKNSPATALHRVASAAGKRFDLLPADLNLAWVVKNPAQMDSKLETILSKIRDSYDYVFIDCAPTDSVLTTMALSASDYLLIPMRPDRFSILGFTNLLATIDTFRENCPDPHEVEVLGIVYTQVTNDSQVEKNAITEIDDQANKAHTYRFAASLGYSKSFIRSVKDQTPIFATAFVHPKTRAAVTKIADELKTRIAAAKPKKAKK